MLLRSVSVQLAGSGPRLPSHRRGVAARAATRTSDGWSTESAYERVLRYPDGKERRIRYPTGATTAPEDNSVAALSPVSPAPQLDNAATSSDDEWLRELADAARAAAGGVVEAPPQAPVLPPAPAAAPSLPSSPAALLALLRSPAYTAAAEAQAAQLAASHVILSDGCPWLVDRPLYVVALRPSAEASTSGGEAGAAAASDDPPPGAPFTLRVRVDRGETAGELDALLAADRARRAREQGLKPPPPPSSSSTPPLISVSSLVDGVIVFACEAHAAAFAASLAERNPPGTEPAGTAQVGAHELFRAATAAAAVVVFVRPPPPAGVGDASAYVGPETFDENWTPPLAADLAAALRAHKKKD